jgi:formate hydrogenlyase subunit 6/NADH:ubiquinone oxidoreductase subunit I
MLSVHPENCAGCLRCQLICSYLYSKKFEVSSARLIVVAREPEYRIEFTEDCNYCGKCAEHCFYGAIVRIEED